MLGLPVPSRLRRAARRRHHRHRAGHQPPRGQRQHPVRARLDHRLRRLAARRRLPGQQPQRDRRLRLRLLLPRRGGGGSLSPVVGRRRRVAALVAALALIAFAVGVFFVVRGRTVTGAATTLVLPPPRGLAIGLDEENANLLGADGGGPAFAPWRERLDAISPTFVRLDVVWSKLQPAADVAPDWNAQQSGCLRDVPPCAAYPGLRGQLRALAARQRADPGRFLGYVVFFGAPSWATAPRHGCVPSGAGPTALALSDAGRRAYGHLAAGVLRVAREEGADLRYWSAWNEPNQPAFLSPQRAACRVDAPPLSPGAYAALVGELRAALDESPGDQQLALGETAAYDTPRPTALSTVEFIGGLPQDVVCASTPVSPARPRCSPRCNALWTGAAAAISSASGSPRPAWAAPSPAARAPPMRKHSAVSARRWRRRLPRGTARRASTPRSSTRSARTTRTRSASWTRG